MVSINYSSREVCCKIVYYGPGLSGKTTNLQYVHSKVPHNSRGKLISLATEADRTLYFDFLPINIGSINGFTAKFQLYTVPGQVYYNATRKLVLRGVDGIVFVADSQVDKMDENIESLLNLEDNLVEYGYSIDDIPVVLQYNKRDLPNVMSVEQLNAQLNKRGWPTYEASATIGNGVFDTLKLIIKLVLDKAKSSGTSRMKPVTAAANFERPADSQKLTVVSAHESGRIPVVADSVASGGIAIDTTPMVGAAVPSSSPYRPYPGSEPAPGARPAAEPVTAAPARVYETPAQVKSMPVDEDITKRGHSPQMAPSLKRRVEPRKRGFFKRMFGIK
jgi:hypothetical protein